MSNTKPNITPLQKLLPEIIKACGRKRYDVFKQIGIKPSSGYRMLKGRTSSANIELMLAALGADIHIGPWLFQFHLIKPTKAHPEPRYVLKEV